MRIKNGIGIVAANGSFLSYDDRYSIYKACGFTSVMIWWGEEDISTREERVSLARKHNLHIADVHSDFYNMNDLWTDSEAGHDKYQKLLGEIEACHIFGVNTIVMHLTNGNNPPEISEIGLKRLGDIFDLALKYGVRIALENIKTSETLIDMLDRYSNRNIKFCYDSGHEHLYSKDIDWLKLYGNRLSAIHLHNNYGKSDDHNKLSQGEIDLKVIAGRLKLTDYEGSLNIESVYAGEDDVDKLKLFLEEVYEEANNFLELLL